MSGQVSRAEERAKRSEGSSASPGRRRRLLQAWAPYLFLLPFMVVFLVFLVLFIVSLFAGGIRRPIP